MSDIYIEDHGHCLYCGAWLEEDPHREGCPTATQQDFMASNPDFISAMDTKTKAAFLSTTKEE